MELGAKFEGWALIELWGKQREAGYVTTQYFGGDAMFRVQVPCIPASEETLTGWLLVGDRFAPPGAVIARSAIPARIRLIAAGAVFALNPATEAAVHAAVAGSEHREVTFVSLPDGAQRSAPEDGGDIEPGGKAAAGEV
jgi:hypothetical protein